MENARRRLDALEWRSDARFLVHFSFFYGKTGRDAARALRVRRAAASQFVWGFTMEIICM